MTSNPSACINPEITSIESDFGEKRNRKRNQKTGKIKSAPRRAEYGSHSKVREMIVTIVTAVTVPDHVDHR